jgi:hypothetical protein
MMLMIDGPGERDMQIGDLLLLGWVRFVRKDAEKRWVFKTEA